MLKILPGAASEAADQSSRVAGGRHSDGTAGGGRTLADRRAAAGVSDRAEPWDAWLQLRAAEGNRATLINLYELVAASQDLAAHELPAATRLSLARQAMAQTWPGFAVTEGSDRPRAPLMVVGCDPAWPQACERWRQRIAAAPGRTALLIEHVGSPPSHRAACPLSAEAKRAGARRWSDDRWAYTEAKTGIILDILEQAAKWAAATKSEPATRCLEGALGASRDVARRRSMRRLAGRQLGNAMSLPMLALVVFAWETEGWVKHPGRWPTPCPA